MYFILQGIVVWQIEDRQTDVGLHSGNMGS